VLIPSVPLREIVLRTALLYLAVLGLLRLAGKREMGQMSLVDLVVILVSELPAGSIRPPRAAHSIIPKRGDMHRSRRRPRAQGEGSRPTPRTLHSQ